MPIGSIDVPMPTHPFAHFPKSKIAGCVAVLALLAACSSPKPAAVSAPATGHPNSLPADQPAKDYVATVRGSVMSGYPTATIGKAFDTAFRDPHWNSAPNSEGVQVVKFTGTFPADVHRDCADCTQGAKVTFQWTFPADGELFHLSYVDPEPWPAALRATRDMLLFIYG